MEISIKHMDISHTQKVEEIGKECFSVPWSLESVRNELINPHSVTFVAISDKNVVGFINAHCILDEGYINNIAVTYNYRKNGIGSKLLNALVQYGKEKNITFFTLEVRKSNKVAIRFYENFYFEQVGERKNFYRNPTEDALLMTKQL